MVESHRTWLGNFSPFVDGGVGNTIADQRFFHRPFMTFGYNASFEAGTEYDAGPFSLTASAYDIAPWGNQTVVSRIFRCSSGSTCASASGSTDRHGYKTTSVQGGTASLSRDNGFNAGVEVKPRPYSRSGIRLQPQRSSATQQLFLRHWRGDQHPPSSPRQLLILRIA